MKLIERLQYIADEINIGETVADIGTDHGFLPLYLLQTGKSPKVIMADISEGSLAKAEENCRIFKAEGSYDLRLGSGLEVLDYGETDVAVFAGMGGQLMRDLLANDIRKTKSIKKFILQPRNKAGVLRLWLEKNGIKIIKEGLVREGRFICEIITAVTGYEEQPGLTWSPDYEYPDLLMDSEQNILRDYLDYKLEFENRIYGEMLQGNDVSEIKLSRARNKIEKLNRMKACIYE